MSRALTVAGVVLVLLGCIMLGFELAIRSDAMLQVMALGVGLIGAGSFVIGTRYELW